MKLALQISFLLLPFFSLAEEDLSKINPLKARGFFVAEELKPGTLADFQVEMQLDEGFFAYHDRFRLKVIQPENLQVGELSIDPLVEFEDTTGKTKKKKMGVNGSATLKTQVEIPSALKSKNQFSFALTYIACTKKYCLTPRTFNFDVEAKIATTTSSSEGFKDVQSSAYIQKQIEQNLAYALVLIFLFGLLTSLTPCIYPLIPITLAVLGANKNQSQLKSFSLSLVYVQGIGLTYAVLGVIAAKTGQLFGSAISHPAVVIAMSLIFFAMGLSLLGLFEIQAPAFIRNRASNSSRGGYVGAFGSGLLAGVIASPCVGPVLVGVLAYIAKTQNGPLGFLLLYTFAMGFGILIIALGTFSQLADRLPRSGAWMNTVKTVLAMALFAMSLYYAWPLAKQYLPIGEKVEMNENKVAWQKFSPDLVEQAKADGKPVIIDFYADWCAACVEMDEFTFSKDPVIELSKQFVMLKVDATSPFEELKDWQAQYNVYGLPTMILINKNGTVLEDLTLTGFEEHEAFQERMKKALN